MISKRCLRCGYEWIPRVDNPKRCARCKTSYWDLFPDGKCEICQRNFQLLNMHHINGNHNDNRKKNKIRICSDCHAQIHSFEVTKKANNSHRRIRNYENVPEILNRIKMLRKKLKWKQ